MKAIKIGITGGNGFIGRHLSSALKKSGYKPFYFDLPENNLVSPDQAQLKKFVKKADVIFHLAGVNRGADIEIVGGSVVATYNLAEAIKKYNPKTKIVFSSSIQAENDSVYGRSKLLAENILEELANNLGIEVSILRLTNVFGEGGKPFYNSVVATFASQAVKGVNLPISDPKRELRLIYVKDVISEFLKELKMNRKNKLLLKKIDSKGSITVGRLAELMVGFAKKSINPKTKLEKELHKTFLSYAKS